MHTERKIRVFIGRWVEGVVVKVDSHRYYIAAFSLIDEDMYYSGGCLSRRDGIVIYKNVVVFFKDLDVDSKIELRATIPDGLKKLEDMVAILSRKSHTRVRNELEEVHWRLTKYSPDPVFDFTIAAHQIWAFAPAIQDGDHAIKSKVFGLLWQRSVADR